MKPSVAVRCVAQCPLDLQQCQWPGALGKVPFNRTQGLSSSNDVSRTPSHQALGSDQRDHLN